VARAVYSYPFLLYTADTPTDLYAVPVGYTAVVREATLFDDLAVVTLQVFVSHADDAPEVTVAYVGGTGFPFYAQWTGRVVVPGGGYIGIDTDSLGDSSQAYVGGYLLSGALPTV